ncbi:O-unit flippase-like protein [Staphylococcus hominis]|uniref:O-unit flippase-like protein n=1 Tax=Staphylococcus hominis TaxID=1290 RepID=UPI00066B1DAA|nr:O-unit flippase-like protein [Staphylococcus hominis]
MKIGKKDVLWGYISLLLVQGINVILLPVILKYLNVAELGVWFTFTSLYALAMLIDFGFQSIITRNISYLWSGAQSIKSVGFETNDAGKAKINLQYFIRVLSAVKSIYTFMGTVIFIIFITIGTFYLIYINNGQINTKVLLTSWLFYMLSIVLNISFLYWNSVLKGIGAIKRYNQILIVTKSTQLILSVAFLIFGLGLIGVSIAYFVSVIVNRILQSIAYYNYSKETKATKRKLNITYDKDILKKLLPNTLRTGSLSISNYLIINFPIILSSYFLSLKVSGQFGFINQIVTLIIMLSNSYYNTYLAKLNYLRVKNKYDELIQLFKKAILTSSIFNIIAFTLFILLGNWALRIIGADYRLLSLIPLLIIIIYRFLYNIQILFTNFLSTKNLIPHHKSFLMSAIITVLVQLVLLKFVDNKLIYLLLPLLLVQLLYNNWYWVWYVIKDIKKDKRLVQ